MNINKVFCSLKYYFRISGNVSKVGWYIFMPLLLSIGSLHAFLAYQLELKCNLARVTFGVKSYALSVFGSIKLQQIIDLMVFRVTPVL